MKVIDAHVHGYPLAEWGRRRKGDHAIDEYGAGVPIGVPDASGDIDSIAGLLATEGVDAALVFNLFEPDRVQKDVEELVLAGIVTWDELRTPGDYLRWVNLWLCEAASSDERLHPVVGVDPTVLSPASIADHLADCRDAGAVGIKLHHPFQHLAPADPMLDPVYLTAQRLHLPIVIHSDRTATPSTFSAAFAAWPRTPFVLAHAGGAAWKELEAVLTSFDHVFADLSELLWWVGKAPAAPDLDALRDLLQNVGADRVLFGSDFPWYSPAEGVGVLRSLDLGASFEAAIFAENARRIFRLN